MIDRVLRTVLLIPAALFTITGIQWIVNPDGVASNFAMSMMESAGLGSQIAHEATYFLTMGVLIGVALLTRARHWFLAPAVMLVFTAFARLCATLLHEADPALGPLVLELLFGALLFDASFRLRKNESIE
ncbi:MAG: hypothetical protein AAFX52_14955 [Pseudomonadota bacterium]